MYKFLRQSTVLMLLTTTIILADPVDPPVGDDVNTEQPEYLSPDQWKFPKSCPEVRPINPNSEFDNKDQKPNAQSHEPDVLPHIPDHVVEDVLEHYPEIAEKAKVLQNVGVHTKFLPDGLVLVGQPGVSKTTIALAMSQLLKRKVAFFEATSLVGDQFQNSGVNFLQAKLGRVIKEIEESKDTQYVVIVDEVMRLAEKFKNEKGEGKDISTKLWLMLDRFKESKRVFFIATANRIDKLPDQLRSRFSNGIIQISTPDEAYREKILLNHLETHHDLSKNQLKAIVKQTEGLTHRDLTNIVMHAGERALTRDTSNPVITQADLIEAFKKNRKCNQKSYKERFVEWADDNKDAIDAGAKIAFVAVGTIAAGTVGYYVVIYGGHYVVIPLVKKAAVAAAVL